MMYARTLLILLALQISGSTSRSDETDAQRPSIMGKVTDPDGKPLPGVRVDISTAAPKVGRGIFCPSCYLDCGKWSKTDDAGQFKLEKLDVKLKFRLVIAAPGRKTQQTELIEPSETPVNIVLHPLPDDIDPKRVVSGVVKNEQGVPVVGAFVEPYGAKTGVKRWWGQVDGVEPTVTDEKGQFAMLLPADFLALDIEVTGNGFSGLQVILLEPGAAPVDLEVKEGARVTGHLVHRGQSVANMTIAVVQLNRSAGDGIFIAAVSAVTDNEGAFEFRNLPPAQQYCIYSVVGDAKRTASDHILTVKKFNVPESGMTRDVGNLEVSDPISIRGHVERIDGKPLPENLTLSLGREPAWDLIEIPVASDGSFEAAGLPPETYEIRVGSRDLVIVPNKLKYQMLSESSFGVHVTSSVEDLIIPVKGK
ncbi:MAG: carboxypeptidase-like regulatory domain-containing protein [Planctomycetaceae bacterium]